MSKKDLWCNWTKKPNNFKFIKNDGKFKFYSYDISLCVSDEFNKYGKCDIINLNIRYLYSEHGYIDIDNDYTIQYLNNNIGKCKYEIANFKRDCSLFTYVSEIFLDEDVYLKYKEKQKLIGRINKILKIKNG